MYLTSCRCYNTRAATRACGIKGVGSSAGATPPTWLWCGDLPRSTHNSKHINILATHTIPHIPLLAWRLLIFQQTAGNLYSLCSYFQQTAGNLYSLCSYFQQTAGNLYSLCSYFQQTAGNLYSLCSYFQQTAGNLFCHNLPSGFGETLTVGSPKCRAAALPKATSTFQCYPIPHNMKHV